MRALAAALLVCAAGCASGPAPPTAGQIDRACVTLFLCEPRFATMGDCAANLFGVNDPERAIAIGISADQVRCLANAGVDCVAAHNCIDLPCVLRCEDLALQCFMVAGGDSCGSRTCATSGTACLGDQLQVCDLAGVFRVRDCAAIGATCGPSPSTQLADCVGTGASCGGGPILSCEGNTLVTCLDSKQARFDCSRLGGVCAVDGNGRGCGFAGVCDSSFAATCADGRRLLYCNNGTIAQIDCVANGFLGCTGPNAHCTPP